MPGSGRQRFGRSGNISPFCQDVRKLAREDHNAFVTNFLKIKTKDADRVYLKPNFPQRFVRDLRDQDRKDRKPIRHYYLKSRQVGISTDCAAEVYTEAYSRDNLEAMIIAHDKTRAGKLLQMCHLFQEELPQALQLELERSTTERLRFAYSKAGIAIMTASNFQAGRGDTLQWVQASELCYYADPIAVMSSLEQLVPLIPGTGILIETTAKGAGTPAHQLWLGAKEGDNPYKAIFLAWQDDPANVIPPFNSDLEAKTFVEQMFFEYPDLQERMKHYKLSLRQIGYYYTILKYKCYGDELFMMQEYPCDAEEAWISSGTPIFGLRQLAEYRMKTLDGKLYTPYRNDKIEVYRNLDGLLAKQDIDRTCEPYVEIWQHPLPRHKYLIGADPSAGYTDSDFCSAYVVDMHTLEMCAEIHGRFEPYEFAPLLATMGYSYNEAIIAPEINDVGLAVQALLQQIYWNIYQWKKIGSYALVPTQVLGWSTTNQTRPLIIANAKNIFRERMRMPDTMGQLIRSRSLIDELRTFVLDDKGKPRAANGCWDDRPMAWMISLTCCMLETYGMLVDDNCGLPAQLLTPQASQIIQEVPKMEDIADQLFNGARGWRKSDDYL